MTLRVVTGAERAFTDDDWEDVVRSVWPAFLLHEASVNEHWWRLDEDFPGFQLLVLDAQDRIVALGNTIPFAWDRSVRGLPDGIRGVLPVAVEGHLAGRSPTTLCALQAVVRPECQGQGISSIVIEAMGSLARARRLDCLVAPVRPTLKHRYPLQPIESYVRWRRGDNLAFDPWLRVHQRLGAELLGIAERSMVIEGSVADWEAWTELSFPESGTYVVPGAHVPVEVNRERDLAVYVEPNVWMRHPVGS